MKKVVVALLALVLGASVIGCTPKAEETTEAGAEGSTQVVVGENNKLNVGVAFFPMKEILELIQDDLKAEGYELTISEFTDYQAPNNLLKDKELDANMIQHDYFLQSFNEANGADLVTVQPIYHATFALYAKDYKTVDEIPDGGPILAQKAVEVREGDTPETLQKRVMEEAEWLLLPRETEKLAAHLAAGQPDGDMCETVGKVL